MIFNCTNEIKQYDFGQLIMYKHNIYQIKCLLMMLVSTIFKYGLQG